MGESIRLLCPELADVLLGREALEGPEAFGEVVGRDKVGEMAAKLILGFAIGSVDPRMLYRSVRVLDMADGFGSLGLGKAMVNVGLAQVYSKA